MGILGGGRISGARYFGGSTLVRIQAFVAIEAFSRFCAAGNEYQSRIAYYARNQKLLPRRSATVTLSLAGNSVIFIPNVLCNMICASAKTALNCLPPVPSTFWPMSARRIGCLEYSQLIAYRTSLRAKISTESPEVESANPSSSCTSSDSGLRSTRLWFPRAGCGVGSLSDSDSSAR